MTPPGVSGRPAWKRVTGMEATSRSDTLMPAALSPAIIARFSIRAERLESRLVTTVVSFFSVVPKAMASRAANSGVMSTLASPTHPGAREEAAGALGLPDDRRVDDRAGLDGLERVHLHAGADHGVLADEALVAEHRRPPRSGRRAAGRTPGRRPSRASRTPSPR